MAVDLDKQIGENVVTLRGEMSQKALAERMRDRGHKWSQSTVWAVEKGDRAVKLAEARDLSEALGNGEVLQLLRQPAEVSYRAIVQRRYNDWFDAREAFVKAASQYESARFWLRQWVEEGYERGQSEVAGAFEDCAEETAAILVEPITAEAEAEYEKRMGRDDIDFLK